MPKAKEDDNYHGVISRLCKNVSVQEQQNRDEEEKIGLLGREVLTTDDDDKDKKVLDVTGRVTNTRRSARRLTASEVEALFDNYELPSDTYSLLLTSDIISIPFFTGIVGCFLSLFALALAFKNEWDNGSVGNVSCLLLCEFVNDVQLISCYLANCVCFLVDLYST